jgi:hypothetical protein
VKGTLHKHAFQQGGGHRLSNDGPMDGLESIHLGQLVLMIEGPISAQVIKVVIQQRVEIFFTIEDRQLNETGGNSISGSNLTHRSSRINNRVHTPSP